MTNTIKKAKKPEINHSKELLDKVSFSKIGKRVLETYYNHLEQAPKESLYYKSDILQAFGDGLLSNSVYDAMAINELTKNLEVEDKKKIVEKYFINTEISEDQQQFVWALLGDLIYTKEKFDEYYEDHKTKYLENEKIDWSKKIGIIDLETMKKVIRNTNLESIIISAADALEKMDSDFYNDQSKFKSTFESKSFYAPISEMIGLDGMAMSLRDKANKNIFEKNIENGSEKCENALNRAEKQFNFAKNIPFASVLNKLGFESENNDYLTNQVAGKKINEENIVKIGDFVVNLEDGMDFAGVYRYKSKYSLAKKMSKEIYKNQPPMDIIGMTFIIDDKYNDISDAFIKFLQKIKCKSDISLKTVAKNSPIYLQGERKWVNQLNSKLIKNEFIAHKEEKEKKSFQVAKVTMDMYFDDKPVGVEVQFIDSKDRRNARIGESAHFIYKLDKKLNEEELENYILFMEEIYNRKPFLKDGNDIPTIKKESLARIPQTMQKFGYQKPAQK